MDLSQMEQKAALGALLFAYAEPLSVSKAASVLNISAEECSNLFLQIQKQLGDASLGIELLQLDDKWQLVTQNAYAPFIKTLLETKRNVPLGPAALEVLAIIAYNQPVSRSFIEQVRGVDSSSTVTSLLEKGLIEEAGRLELPGRPVSFRTTDTFLRCFDLKSLQDLPSLHPEENREEELPLEYLARNGEIPEDTLP